MLIYFNASRKGASVDMERFDAVVKSMTNIDVSKETAREYRTIY
jgi:hypothetical protein